MKGTCVLPATKFGSYVLILQPLGWRVDAVEVARGGGGGLSPGENPPIFLRLPRFASFDS